VDGVVGNPEGALWRWVRRRAGLLLFVAYLVGGLYLSRPVLSEVTSAIPFGTTTKEQDLEKLALRPADSSQFLYFNWNFADNLENGRNPFANVYEYGPLNERGLHSMGLWGFPLQLPFAVLYWLFGLAFAYNFILIATFPLTGLLQYWFVRTLDVTRPFAALAGLVYAFALFRRVQMFSGHGNGFLFFHLPLASACMVLAVRRGSWKWGVGAGLAIVSIAFGEWHDFYYSSLFWAPFMAWLLWTSDVVKRWRERGLQAACFTILGFELIGVAYALWLKSTLIAGTAASTNRGLASVKGRSPSPLRLFEQSRYLSADIWAGADVESALYLGNALLITLAIAVVAWAVIRRRGGSAAVEVSPFSRRSTLLFFIGATVASTWLALGTTPDRIIPVYELLFDYLPFWKLSRVPTRIMYLAHFGLAVVVALVFQRLLLEARARGGPRVERGVWALFFMGTISISYDIVWSGPQAFLSKLPSGDNAVVRTLSALPDDDKSVILYLPIYSADGSQNAAWEIYTTVMKRPFLNGYAPTAPLAAKELLARLKVMNDGKLPLQLHEELWALGVRHVVVDKKIRFLRSAKAKRRYINDLVKAGVMVEVERADGVIRYALKDPEERRAREALPVSPPAATETPGSAP